MEVMSNEIFNTQKQQDLKDVLSNWNLDTVGL